MKQNVVPKQNDIMFRYLFKSLNYKINDIVEMTAIIETSLISKLKIKYLPLALWNFLGINIFRLESGKQKFCWNSIITVGPCVKHRYSETFHKLKSTVACMIWSSIEQNNGVLSPINVFTVKF